MEHEHQMPLSDVSEFTGNLYDPKTRAAIRAHDPAFIEKIKPFVDVDKGVEFRVVTSTRDVTYLPLPLPPDESAYLSAEELSNIQGGVKASTAGTIGTASSFCTFTGCISTFHCIGTLGSAGTGSTPSGCVASAM